MAIKNILILLTLVLVSFSSMAQSETATGLSEDDQIDSDFEDFATQLNNAMVMHESGYIVNGVEVNDRCESLINKSGGLGALGRFARQELTSKVLEYRELMSPGALSRTCENYPNLNVGERAMVWALILTTMAHFESSCDVAVAANGPNGTAKGLWQLHEGKEAIYDGTEDKCIKNASNNPVESVRCTLGMLAHQMTKSSGILFWARSYWDVLRPNGESKKAGKIEKALKNSRLCAVH